ncbi:MAG: pyridoxal phosphate-dependent aminotransferase [bacterium]
MINYIPPFIVMEILERAKQIEKDGRQVIHLEVGEPDFDTPNCIKEAAIRAIKEGKTKYTHSLGLLELREAIAEYYLKEYQVTISPEQIIITSGTSVGLLLIFACLLDTGDEVILPHPYYPCYPNFIKFLKGVPVFVELEEADGFWYHPDKIKEKISKKTKAILVNSPSNPAGRVLDDITLKKIVQLGKLVVSDEIYHGLVYETQAHSILEFTERAFVLNGFSKRYAMTGWRLGYLIAPKEYVRTIQKLQQNFFICANEFVQLAGISAICQAQMEVKKMVESYDKRRRFMVDKLKNIGFGIPKSPDGAFYILANATRFSKDSFKLAIKILEETLVAVTPGIDFGSRAEGYIRFAYTNSLENIREALFRIEEYLK